MNTSNLLTLSRLVLAGLFLACMMGGAAVAPGGFQPTVTGLVLALVVVVLNFITDYYDGALARRHKEVSDFGKLMDPVTDAVFYITVFACYVYRGWMPLALFALVLARELFMNVSLRPFLAARGVVLGAGPLGKAKTVVQGVVTAALIVFEFAVRMGVGGVGHLEWFNEAFLRFAALGGISIVAALSLGSLAKYLMGARAAFRAKADDVTCC